MPEIDDVTPATCRKVGYPDEAAAERELARIREKADMGFMNRREDRCYYHVACGAWHLTSSVRVGAPS